MEREYNFRERIALRIVDPLIRHAPLITSSISRGVMVSGGFGFGYGIAKESPAWIVAGMAVSFVGILADAVRERVLYSNESSLEKRAE